MMSLYDYLGRPAGSELGQRVAAAASQNKVKYKIPVSANKILSIIPLCNLF